MEKYEISKEELENLFNRSARIIVGQCMKRFELFDDKEVIKKEVKELIYENIRNLKELIKSFSMGMKFITSAKDKN